MYQNVLGPFAPSGTATADPTVTMSAGVVIGTTFSATNLPSSTATANAYLGIPFAKSPPERFSPPQDPVPWSSPLLAQTPAPGCIAQNLTGSDKTALDYTPILHISDEVEQSEDCLYLNVYAPPDASPSNLKEVMFWVYGGNLMFGDSNLPFYNGTSFAVNEDVVVVSHNYRTNIFGFSNAGDLPADQRNVGFLDQRQALDWVQKNIKQFGGDPTKVTVFGESAGGFSVKQLLANPPSPLPFRAAIVESEQALFHNGPENYQKVLENFNCPDVDCLRGISAIDIVDYIQEQTLLFGPTEDDKTYISNVTTSIDSGQFADVPIMLGTNKNELSALVWAISQSSSYSIRLTLAGVLVKLFDVGTIKAWMDAGDILQYVEASTGQDPTWDDISRVATDLAFTCTTGAIVNYTADHGYDVWRYRFSASVQYNNTFPGEGAVHASEVPGVFNTWADPTNATLSALGQYMNKVWAGFAKDPAAGPGWPHVGENQDFELGDIGEQGNPGQQPISLGETDSYCDFLLPYANQFGLAW
ncbi:hypothetical protein ETB97_006143 [Aspergillus alliaceus]|uniref:Carboxylic ester hydrolase n=1 Tax=Petromyces alliaceus TaxID=209559 RepID=A0A5N7CFG9_PETAA|nr:Carboxylesterase [Aspergillus alliaceus]KAF5864913.1 hypothetical protein ETB97_006143 [Aspergillus burnettii]